MNYEIAQMDEINAARARICDYYNRLDGFFLKRGDLLKLMMVAVAAQEPMLFIGRPGTAKSLLVSVFCQGMGMGQDEYFEYMLTKFTEPSEIMGPVDIQQLKEGRYLRKVEGHLPKAKIAFLDEIFKANSAILNVLLTEMNANTIRKESLTMCLLYVCLRQVTRFLILVNLMLLKTGL
jgi:MoxR-like ATPase